MILNTPFISDLEAIRRPKQDLIDKRNQNENDNSKPHSYRLCDKVLVRYKKVNKCDDPYNSPYPITKVWKNGTVTIHRGVVQERINIGWIKPYHE